MMVIKKQLNLGDLIAITIAGGFGLRKNCNAQQQYLYKNHVD